jgi:hypothetical protein
MNDQVSNETVQSAKEAEVVKALSGEKKPEALEGQQEQQAQ